MPYRDIENLLRQRPAQWWNQVTAAVPELEALNGTVQPEAHHGEGDAAMHTRKAVEACPADADGDLLWAALLHDVGKPAATRIDGSKITAYGHDKIGAELANRILQHLQMPAHRRRRIVWAVRHHMFHISWNLKAPEACSAKQRRFILDPRFPLLLELVKADSAASESRDRRKADAYRFYRRLRSTVEESET